MYSFYILSSIKPVAKIVVACYMPLACSSAFALGEEEFAGKLLEIFKTSVIEYKAQNPEWDIRKEEGGYEKSFFVSQIGKGKRGEGKKVKEGERNVEKKITYKTTEKFNDQMGKVAGRMAELVYSHGAGMQNNQNGQGLLCYFALEVAQYLELSSEADNEQKAGEGENRISIYPLLALLCFKCYCPEECSVSELVNENIEQQEKMLDYKIRFVPLISVDKILNELLCDERGRAFLNSFFSENELDRFGKSEADRKEKDVSAAAEKVAAYISAKAMGIQRFRPMREIRDMVSKVSEPFPWWKVDFPAKKEDVLKAFVGFLNNKNVSMFFDHSQDLFIADEPLESGETSELTQQEFYKLLCLIEENDEIIDVFEFLLLGACAETPISNTLFRVFLACVSLYGRARVKEEQHCDAKEEKQEGTEAFQTFCDFNNVLSVYTVLNRNVPLKSDKEIPLFLFDKKCSCKDRIAAARKYLELADFNKMKEIEGGSGCDDFSDLDREFLDQALEAPLPDSDMSEEL